MGDILKIKTARDVRGHDFTFILSKKGELSVLGHTDNRRLGKIKLEETHTVEDFDAIFDSSFGGLRLVVAIKDTEDGTQKISMLDNGGDTFSERYSHPLDGIITSEDKISKLAISDGEEIVIVIDGSAGKDVAYYHLSGKVNGDPQWKQYSLSEHSSHIEDISFGMVNGDRGVFVLYDVTHGTGLQFQSFINSRGMIRRYRFDCSQERIISIATSTNLDGNSCLYAMYDKGIWLFENPENDGRIIFDALNGFKYTSFSVTTNFTTASISAIAVQDRKDKASFSQSSRNLHYSNGGFNSFSFILG